MTDWAYIATPYGASLFQTLQLARGHIPPRAKTQDRLFENCGIIFRKIYRKNGEAIQNVLQKVKLLKPSDTLLLMYNFAHTGLVYPVQQFKVLDPLRAKNKIDIQRENGFGAIGKINIGKPFIQKNFVPDYLDSEDIESAIQHIICVEPSGSYLPNDKVGMVCVTHNPHDLALKDLNGLQFIPEKNGEFILDRKYNNIEKCSGGEDSLTCEYKSIWGELDGWAKICLYENLHLEEMLKTNILADKKYLNYYSEALPLCSLFEYVLNKMLKRKADALILKNGLPMFELPEYQNKEGKPIKPSVELPVVPEATAEDLDCGRRIQVLSILVERNEINIGSMAKNDFKNLLHTLRKLRNRIAHSYFIELRHYETMKSCLHNLLKVFCLNGG